MLGSGLKDRQVMAFEYPHGERLLSTLRGEVFLKLLAQQARVGADDAVFA